MVENHQLRLKSTARSELNNCHQAAEATMLMVIQGLSMQAGGRWIGNANALSEGRFARNGKTGESPERALDEFCGSLKGLKMRYLKFLAIVGVFAISASFAQAQNGPGYAGPGNVNQGNVNQGYGNLEMATKVPATHTATKDMVRRFTTSQFT
jgi:hypothetical protein